VAFAQALETFRPGLDASLKWCQPFAYGSLDSSQGYGPDSGEEKGQEGGLARALPGFLRHEIESRRLLCQGLMARAGCK
jgi:hypothetical protein